MSSTLVAYPKAVAVHLSDELKFILRNKYRIWEGYSMNARMLELSDIPFLEGVAAGTQHQSVRDDVTVIITLIHETGSVTLKEEV